LVLKIEDKDMPEQLMRQGPDRRDVGQGERDFVLELLFGFLEDADGAAILVDFLRELVFC
jgi:hypothetical protein